MYQVRIQPLVKMGVFLFYFLMLCIFPKNEFYFLNCTLTSNTLQYQDYNTKIPIPRYTTNTKQYTPIPRLQYQDTNTKIHYQYTTNTLPIHYQYQYTTTTNTLPLPIHSNTKIHSNTNTLQYQAIPSNTQAIHSQAIASMMRLWPSTSEVHSLGSNPATGCLY